MRTLLCMYIVVYFLLPLAFLLKDTKDIILRTEPDPSMMGAYFQCNGFQARVAQTIEENVQMAKIDAIDQLKRLSWSVPICFIWIKVVEKLEKRGYLDFCFK